MKLGIMQPYFLPYIGYFQLIHAVDTFVIYNNIQYTKKGWINRNRFLKNGTDALFSVALRNDSDFLNVNDRYISDSYDKQKLMAQLKSAYLKSPEYKNVMPVIEDCIFYVNNNLFDYIFYSVNSICNYLNIKTKIQTSSDIDMNHQLKGQDKVLEICKKKNATIYINAIGGQELYSKDVFYNNGIELRFIKSRPIEYKQFNNIFVPWLSIVDVLMFNTKETVSHFLNNFELV